MRRRNAFTLIELMIVVIIVAILAASAVPIYRSMVSRAYEAEIVSGLSIFRAAERMYRAEYKEYTNLAGLENNGLVGSNDFRDMRYVAWAEYSIPASAADTYAIRWTRPGVGDVADYKYSQVDMDQGGQLVRTP